MAMSALPEKVRGIYHLHVLPDPVLYVFCNYVIIQILEHEMIISGDTLFRQIDNRTVAALGVCYQYGIFSCPVIYFIDRRRHGSRHCLVVKVGAHIRCHTGIGSHLTEELVQRFFIIGELRSFIRNRFSILPAADTELCIPSLVQYLCTDLSADRSRSCLSSSRLVDQKYTVAHPKEHVRPAFPAVRSRHPSHTGLSVSMKKYHGESCLVFRNLIEDIGMNSAQGATRENNLASLGYVDFDNPSEISIYPVDFDSKEHVAEILSAYNSRMEAEGMDDQVITYTDMVGTLMSSVTDIIDIISYVLIAFVAISLVVSSIMIGVITYISVLERKKEIGILRAIGASKGNISQVFNAETFIIGLCAGLIGIGLTLLLLIPGNALIHHLAGTDNINAFLPAGYAVILIALSVFLTLLGGLIPSRKAAKSDPVTALRTE